MARTEATLNCCMITQQLDEIYFNWSDAELQAIRAADAAAIGDVILQRLAVKGYAAAEIHTIIHDSDSTEAWDNIENAYVITDSPKHFHSVVKFGKNLKTGKLMSGTLAQIADAIGIEPQYVEKAGKGKYAYDNMLSYLIHIKYTEKYQYAPEAVVTAGCVEADTGKPLFKPYMDYYKERKKDWEAGRAKRKAQQAKLDIDVLEEKILLGEVTKNQVLLTDAFFDIYARNKRRCEDAFDTYAERKAALAIRALEAGEFKVSVFFLTGRSGSGKTYATTCFAKHLQLMAKEKLGQDWQVCDACASNSFDKYAGEEILVMDDLRGMAMSSSDWLKLMTEDKISDGSARYSNKKMCCRVVIINSERDVLDFFYFAKGNGSGSKGEAMDQFFRRILARVEVIRCGDERLYEIGRSVPTDPYSLPSPAEGERDAVTLNFDFAPDGADMTLDEALDYLSDLVWQRNTLKSPASQAARAADADKMADLKYSCAMDKLNDSFRDALIDDEIKESLPKAAATAAAPNFNPNWQRSGGIPIR